MNPITNQTESNYCYSERLDFETPFGAWSTANLDFAVRHATMTYEQVRAAAAELQRRVKTACPLCGRRVHGGGMK